MKHFVAFSFWCLWLSVCLVSCKDSGKRVAEGSPYIISGTLWQDSLTVDSCMTLFVDRHEDGLTASGEDLSAYESVTVPVVNGRFSYQGHAPFSVDEVTIADQHHHSVRIFAQSGSQIEVSFDAEGKVHFAGTDSLNQWLNLKMEQWASRKPENIKPELDSLCSLYKTDIRAALLLRQAMPLVSDSVFVRRQLGKLSAEAKPEWLMDDVNELFDMLSNENGRSTRLPKIDVAVGDTIYSLQASRQESLVLLFWADYDSASIDSLKIFNQISRDYGLYSFANNFHNEKSATRSKNARRIELMSVCMHTADSASWQAAVKDIPGKHVILPGGFAHPLAETCQVSKVPSIFVFDRFSNYQSQDKWGTSIYEFLNRASINSDVMNPKKKK